MKLRSLEAFCAAVEEGTISGAARRMYLSQPSVSERLAGLEREARVSLLKRSRRGVEPTEQGALLYERARKVLDELQALDRVFRALHERDLRLRFAASSTLGEHLLPEWLGEFRKTLPGISPEVFVGNTREVVEMVGGGEVAFGVIEGEERYHGEIESLPLLDDELVVVVAPGHPWARRGITVEDLPKEPFISREKGSGTREVIERALKEMGDVSLNIQAEIGSTSGIKEAIEAGLGFSILSRAAIRLEVRAGNLAIAEGVAISRRFSLIRHAPDEMSPVEQDFYDYLMGVREKSGAVWNVVK